MPADDAFGERSVRERVAERLRELEVPFTERPLAASTGGFGSALFAEFPAAARSDNRSGFDTLVFAVPLSTSPREAGAPLDYGVAVALALAGRLDRSNPPLRVAVAFLADEKTELPADLRGRVNSGLRDLAESYAYEAEKIAFVYVDLPDAAVRPELSHGSAGRLAPRNLVSSLIGSFSENGMLLPLSNPYNELYRLNLVAGPEELRILRDRGIPGVLIAQNRRMQRYGQNEEPPSADLAADAIVKTISRLAGATAENDERYSVIAFGPAFRILPEGPTVAVFVSTMAFFLLSFLIYSLTHRYLMVARLKVFMRSLWVVLVFLAIMYLCVRAAGLALSFVLSTAKATAADNPYGAAAVKLLLLFSFYYAVSPILSLKIFPRRAHFYGSAAVVCLAIGVLIAAALDFTFVPVFIWTFALAFFSTAMRSPTAAAIPAFLAPIQFAGAAAAAAGSGDPDTAFAVLNAAPSTELYFAFLVLPFPFLFRRLSILARAKTLRRARFRAPSRGYRRYTRPIMLAGALVAAAAFARDTAQAARERPLPTRGATADAKKFRLGAQESTFLDRRIAKLEFRAEGRPIRFDLTLTADAQITVYDSPVPFVLSHDGKSAVFALGERPPNPLELEITLPYALSAEFEARAVFYQAPEDSALTYRAALPVGPVGPK